MQNTYGLTIRGSETSPYLRDQMDALFEELQEDAPLIKRYKLQVCLSVENGPRAPGPDVYGCALIATPRSGTVLRASAKNSSLYEAASNCFSALRRQLQEEKRDRVDRRNDLPRIRMGGKR